MKRIRTVNQLIAIVLIAWFAVPICCCSGKDLSGDSKAATRSCCQSAKDVDSDSDDSKTPDCPCGKRTLAEGKAEIVIFASAADSLTMASATEWIPEAIPSLEIASCELPQHLDLPPPSTSWFAVSGSWLL